MINIYICLTFAICYAVEQITDRYRRLHVMSHCSDIWIGIILHDCHYRVNLKRVHPSIIWINQMQHVILVKSCKSFIEPQVMPKCRRNQVAKVLVLKLLSFQDSTFIGLIEF